MTMNSVLKHAERHCQEVGARLTDKRKRILSALLKSKRAMSAYELAEYCRGEFDEAFPVMSIYRILEFLESENLVHKLQLANKYIACAHISCDHAHEVPQFLICSECGQVKEIGLKNSVIDSLKASVQNAGFVLLKTQLELQCLCQDCSSHAV